MSIEYKWIGQSDVNPGLVQSLNELILQAPVLTEERLKQRLQSGHELELMTAWEGEELVGCGALVWSPGLLKDGLRILQTVAADRVYEEVYPEILRRLYRRGDQRALFVVGPSLHEEKKRFPTSEITQPDIPARRPRAPGTLHDPERLENTLFDD